MWGAGLELRGKRGGLRSRQSWCGLVMKQLASVTLKPCTVTVVPGGKRPKKRVRTLQVALDEGGGRRGGLRK